MKNPYTSRSTKCQAFSFYFSELSECLMKSLEAHDLQKFWKQTHSGHLPCSSNNHLATVVPLYPCCSTMNHQSNALNLGWVKWVSAMIYNLTKFLGTVNDYTDLKLSWLTLSSQCCLHTSFWAHLPKQHCGRARYYKVFQQFCPRL